MCGSGAWISMPPPAAFAAAAGSAPQTSALFPIATTAPRMPASQAAVYVSPEVYESVAGRSELDFPLRFINFQLSICLLLSLLLQNQFQKRTEKYSQHDWIHEFVIL